MNKKLREKARSRLLPSVSKQITDGSLDAIIIATLDEASKLCYEADKSTHPTDLGILIDNLRDKHD